MRNVTHNLKVIDCYKDDIYECNDVSTILNWFKDNHKQTIAEICRVTDSSEWNMDNFGLGSAWINESPFVIGLEWMDGVVRLTIREVGV